jgi:hypothetical protein
MTDVSPVSPISPTATRLQWLAPVALVAVLFAMSWWAYDRLPPRIVLQTLFSGFSDRHAQSQSAAQLAFLMPALVAVVTIGNLLVAHWNVLVWPRKTLSSRDAAAMWPLAIRLTSLAVAQLIVVHAFTLAAALGWISEIAGLRGAGVVFSLGFAVSANLLPLVTRPNTFVGYRLTVFYNDPERWRKAQRMAGYCFVAAGLLFALLFVIAPVLGTRLLIPVFAVAMLAPVLLTRRGAAQRESA